MQTFSALLARREDMGLIFMPEGVCVCVFWGARRCQVLELVRCALIPQVPISLQELSCPAHPHPILVSCLHVASKIHPLLVVLLPRWLLFCGLPVLFPLISPISNDWSPPGSVLGALFFSIYTCTFNDFIQFQSFKDTWKAPKFISPA